MRDIIIVGGGLGGLITAILSHRKGFEVVLIEKKEYPFHRVCGEYISHETLPFLRKENLLPPNLDLPSIKKFQYSSIKGKSFEMALDLGGFGLSRYTFDQHLFEIAKAEGVEVWQKQVVSRIDYVNGVFQVESSNGKQVSGKLVVGAYGKRSNIDVKLERSHTQKRAPYIGVKYHIKTDFPKDQISLHNFQNGYCGVSAIENDKYNLCYLGSRKDLKKYGSIDSMEQETVQKNPFLADLFQNSDFLFDQPEVINEFSFAPKKLIEEHIFMVGDAAGLITPLCGNGMAMAIHSAKLLSDLIHQYYQKGDLQRAKLEQAYLQEWNKIFKMRLWVGRKTQSLFGAEFTSELAIGLMKNIPSFAKTIMKNTHGEPF